MRNGFPIVLAALSLAIAPFAAMAQKAPTAAAPNAAVFVGAWSGATDWDGTDYDNANGTWTFRADGSFVDDFGATGSWQVEDANAIRFQYSRDDGSQGSVYTGRLIGQTLLGTMTNGDISGVFALRR